MFCRHGVPSSILRRGTARLGQRNIFGVVFLLSTVRGFLFHLMLGPLTFHACLFLFHSRNVVRKVGDMAKGDGKR